MGVNGRGDEVLGCCTGKGVRSLREVNQCRVLCPFVYFQTGVCCCVTLSPLQWGVCELAFKVNAPQLAKLLQALKSSASQFLGFFLAEPVVPR